MEGSMHGSSSSAGIGAGVGADIGAARIALHCMFSFVFQSEFSDYYYYYYCEIKKYYSLLIINNTKEQWWRSHSGSLSSRNTNASRALTRQSLSLTHSTSPLVSQSLTRPVPQSISHSLDQSLD